MYNFGRRCRPGRQLGRGMGCGQGYGQRFNDPDGRCDRFPWLTRSWRNQNKEITKVEEIKMIESNLATLKEEAEILEKHLNELNG